MPIRLAVVPQTHAFGIVLEVVKFRGTHKRRRWNELEQKGPSVEPGPPQVSGLPATPAVADTCFDAGIVLSGPAKVGVQIIDLDQSQGDVLRQLVVCARS